MRNSIKRLTACLALTLVLVLALGSTAFATTAQYRSTQNFLDFLDGKGIKYTYVGVVDTDIERVNVSYTLDNFASLQCSIFFKSDCEEVSLRIWNIIKAKAGKSLITATLNELNADYKFVKYVYDESDSTVQAEVDQYIDGDHCGRSVYDSMMVMFREVDNNEIAAKIKSLE